MASQQQKAVVGILAALAALIVGYLVWQSSVPSEEPGEPAAEEAGDAEGASGATVTEPAAREGLTYGQALNTYSLESGNGYRFQFVNCNGTPGSLAMKVGTKFMLDNRDNEPHTFVVGTTTYQIGAEGFAIATATLEGTYNITCDGGGASQVIVQP